MSTLLLRLAGPLQAWGTDSKYDVRRTGREPSKSGVIGLLAAALGRKRDESVEDLNSLRFGVRVDKEGELLRDFHTAHGRDNKDNTSYVTQRYYLADGVFVAGFESGDEAFLLTLEQALHMPVYPLFLGRRSCTPTLPLSLGVSSERLPDSLKSVPWQAPEWYKEKLAGRQDTVKLRIILDAAAAEPGLAILQDAPLSFDPRHRRFEGRAAVQRMVELPIDVGIVSTDHDPMAELG